MMLTLLSLALALEPNSAEPPKSLLVKKPKSIGLNEVLVLKPIAHHHFNLDAPHRCGSLPWHSKSPQRLTCKITKPGPHRIVVGICDAKKTFCKLERFELTTLNP